MDVKSEDPDENFNPWIVNNLDEFLFFCCPECDTQSPNKALFINHALIEHPKGQLILKCPFGVLKSPKKPTNFFPEFLPWPL